MHNRWVLDPIQWRLISSIVVQDGIWYCEINILHRELQQIVCIYNY